MSKLASSRVISPHPELVGNRYQIEKILGKGGMAIVYQVYDRALENHLALKLLENSKVKESQKKIGELFKYEFHILSQLVHPRIIEVYDFGVDERGSYYTMELLDGGDLRERSPLPWKKACSLLRDICSALSLIHSRRQIHRDLTPRNIRCTRDEKAKLIDFGAMVPIGNCKNIVGTPPFTAPEVIDTLALDARVDLYSLGATAYYTLTGRNAYPARNFRELQYMWQQQPVAPSCFIDEIPKELDRLVMSLLNLDVLARPINAAEVIEKLNAIASLEPDDQLSTSKAYLVTPILVGRKKHLVDINQQLRIGETDRVNTILIEGSAGVGRSRFLDACVLEGKLAGATVLRADAKDKHAGNWGTIRAIASQLLENFPEISKDAAYPHLPILGHILPDLANRLTHLRQDNSIAPCEGVWVRFPSFPPPMTATLGSVPPSDQDQEEEEPEGFSYAFSTWTEVWGRGNSWLPPTLTEEDQTDLEELENPKEIRPRVQAAFLDWLVQITHRHFVMIAVDDIHQIDEPSAAFFSILSNKTMRGKLFLIVTAESDAPVTSPSAMKLLQDSCTRIHLSNLRLDETERLLSSVFGEVPKIRVLADRLYSHSQGNPLAVMQFAQHLVDKDLIRYQTGTWTLPSQLDEADLPLSLSDALIAKTEALNPLTLQFIRTAALSSDLSFSFEDCAALIEPEDPTVAIQIIEELISAEILSTDGKRYSFRHQGWVSILIKGLDDQGKQQANLKLAAMFEKREDDGLRIARHLFQAGELERGYDQLINLGQKYKHILLNSAEDTNALVASLPSDWVDTFESAIEYCKRSGKPSGNRYLLQSILLNLGATAAKVSITHLTQVISRLYHDSGLSLYHQLDKSLDASTRLSQTLELAQKNYERSPENERYLAPLDAITELARIMSVAISFSGISYDYSILESLPSLEPYIPLSPALGLVDKNVQNTSYAVTARSEQARQGYIEILDHLSHPDRAGLDELTHQYVYLSVEYAIGIIEASIGLQSALKWADAIEHTPLFEVNAWRIRMVSHLFQGNITEAEQCKKQMELLQIQNSPSQFFEGSYIYPELLAYSRADDLTGTKQTISALQKMANRYSGWVPILYYAQGEYHRIRSDYRTAIAELEKALDLTEPGHHTVWPFAASCYLKVLFELERFDELVAQALPYIEESKKAGLGYTICYLKMPLALAEAKLQKFESAVQNAQDVIQTFKEMGSTGLNLGIAYETRARVAIDMHHQDHLQFFSHLCAEQYLSGDNPATRARFEKLIQESHNAGIDISTATGHSTSPTQLSLQHLRSKKPNPFAGCRTFEDRILRILDVLTERSNASGGFIYTMQKGGLELSIKSDGLSHSDSLDMVIKDYMAEQFTDDETDTVTEDQTYALTRITALWTNEKGVALQPVLLAHNTNQGYAITGLAVLCTSDNKPYRYPIDSTVMISQTLLRNDDVVPVYMNYSKK